ncbi:MAG: phosphoribosylanthranilate isomerase [Actinomycetota bacterium]|nr:phosphoribosylanthranilate isomerase [Actinomycetota bacterium]
MDELDAAIEAGASAVGLVSSMPSGPGVIPDERVAEIADRVPPGVDSFLLTSQQDAESIIEQHRRARTSTLQLVDKLPAGAHGQLRAALPGIRLVQVVHVVDDRAIEEAAAAAEFVDAVLLDSGNPTLDVKELGGTGRRHNWAVSARIRRQLDVPVFLAGGLNPDNVAEAIDTVQPFGLDVCTGVRDEAFALDRQKLDHFGSAITSAGGR